MKSLLQKSISLRTLIISVCFMFLAVGVYLTRAESKDEKIEKKPEPTPTVATPPTLKLSDPLPANLFVELARVINPAVVSIQVAMPTRLSGQRGNPQMRDPFLDFLEEFMGPQMGPGPRGRPPQQDTPPQAQSIGTGFVIESDGLIVTNNHVVEAGEKLQVQMIDGEKTYPAEVVGKDSRTDIALIRIKADKKLSIARLGTSQDLQVGEWVAAFGNPYGHTFSMSKGIISAKGRSIRPLNSIPFLQTDASINPGNSGGPLVNSQGLVVGVNAAIDARAQGIGFAIPIDEVKKLIPILKKDGRIAHGFIGVDSAPLNPRAANALGLESMDGALVMGILQNGPAAKAGIEPYDVIVKLGKDAVSDPEELSNLVKDTAIGTTVPVEVLRNGKKKSLKLTISERPEDKKLQSMRGPPRPLQGRQAPMDVGFRVENYSDILAKQLGITSDGAQKGPIITEIQQGSIAAKGGLQVGDMVLDVNKQKITSAQDVISKMKPGENIFRVIHNGRISLVFLGSR